MPKIFNHVAYHAAVRRNAAGVRKVQESFFKKGLGAKGNRVVSRAAKKVGYALADKYGGPGTSAFIKSVSGKGDYKVHSGRAIKGHRDGGSMGTHHAGRHTHHRQSLEKGEMKVSHSEYIGELISGGVTGNSLFTSQLYGINPGNVSTFPWLSSIATNFQEYKFGKLIFEYKPLISESTSTSAATLTSMGTVMIGTQYDSSVGPYLNKQQLENSDYSVSTKPSNHMMMAVECDPKFNPLGVLYVSAQTSPTSSGVSNADIRMQNLGLVQFASVGQPIASSTPLDLGEIWVHYEVNLYKPVQGYYGSILSGHWIGNTATGVAATTTPFGPNVTAAIQPTAQSGTLLGCTFAANGTITFPLAITQGNYLVAYSCNGAGAVIDSASFNAVTNGTLLGMWSGVNTTIDAPTNAATSGTLICMCIVSVNAPGASLCTIKLTTTVVPTAGLYDVVITSMNDNIVT